MKATLLTLALTLLAVAPAWASEKEMAAFSESYEAERAGDYAKAFDVLNGVDGKKPTYLAEVRRGWLKYQAADYQEARRHYQNAMRISPKAIEPRLGFTLPTLALGKYDETEMAVRAILAIDPSNYTARVRLTYTLRMQGKFRQARELNTQLLEYYPTDIAILTEQMFVSVASNQNDVRAFAERILTLDPNNANAKYYLTPATNTVAK
ncbi:MAG: hypothetical protein JSS27_06855 [Planctomycetes bacterium]|nr:hypothetical protein [Planctomycetota bacterium]